MEGINPKLLLVAGEKGIILPPDPRPPSAVRPVHLIAAAVIGVIFVTAAVLGYEHGKDGKRGENEEPSNEGE